MCIVVGRKPLNVSDPSEMHQMNTRAGTVDSGADLPTERSTVVNPLNEVDLAHASDGSAETKQSCAHGPTETESSESAGSEATEV
jgi:hypothetical protein